MGPMVVYVHGNGNKVREELLKQLNSTRMVGQLLGLSDHAAAVVVASW